MNAFRRDKRDVVFKRIIASLATAGLALNLYLLVRHFTGGNIAGCGAGNCDEVLASRWAYLFRVPVAAFGVMAYLALLLSFHRRFESWRTPVVGLITGAALWFLFVQSVVLQRLCPWCLAAHGIALSLCAVWLMRRGKTKAVFFHAGGWLLAGAMALGLAQAYGPEPVTHRLADNAGADGAGSSQGRDALPLLGSPSAKHVMVEYFDYQCASCRSMAGFLEALVARHPEEIAVRLSPVPMDLGCNPKVPHGSHRRGGCGMAKTALAVWHRSPESFVDFHRKLLADPSPENARQAALELMNPDELDALTAGRRVFDGIQNNVATWRKLSLDNPKLPKLLIRPGRMLHGLPPSEDTFIETIEGELGL